MSILMGKIKGMGLVALGLTLATAAGVVAAGGPERLARVIRPPAPRLVADDPPADRVGRIYLGTPNDRGMIAIHPTTGAVERVAVTSGYRARVSPDGRRVAYLNEESICVRELARVDAPPHKLVDLDGAAFGTPPVWSPDGSKLIVSLGYNDKPWRFHTVRVNADGTGRVDLPIPPENSVQDWAPGDWVVTESARGSKIGWQVDVMKTDGTESRRVTEGGNPWPSRLSPDGTQILYADKVSDGGDGVWVVGRDGKNRRKVATIPNAYIWSSCWSPDGKRIATVVVDKMDQGKESSDGRLIVQGVDGSGRAEFVLKQIGNADMPDWR